MSSAVLVKARLFLVFIGRAIENDGVTRVDCFGPSLCLLESTAAATTTTCYATKELHKKPLARRIINPLAEKERSKREMTRNHSEDVTLLFNNYRPFSTLRISKELFEVDSIISRYFCLLRCRYCYFPFWSREYRQHSTWIRWWERVGKLSSFNFLRHFEKVCIEQTKLAIFPSTWHCKGEFCFS